MTHSKTKGSFLKKFKRQSKPLRTTFLLIGIIYLITLLFFTKSLLSLTGIETGIRTGVLIVFFLHLIVYFFIGVILLFTSRRKSLIFLIILTCIYSPLFAFLSFYIDKTYGIIDNVQKKYINYTSYMISLKDTTEYNKIGMISAKEDPTGYVIPKEMIKKENITGEIVEYDDYISMMTELYDGNIDAMFVANSYVTMFNSYEKFASIDQETKVVYEMSKELENVDNITYSTKDLTEPFTLLLMGVDGTGDGIASSASFNGDSLMLITFNPKTLAATIFSIPRDTYVPISCQGGAESKINSSAYGGTTCVVKTIENLTGINIDYYVKINFTGVVRLVDDLGGINVDVPIEFCEQDSERRFGEYEICLKKGYQKLNGEQALALARHRHSLPLGDFQRVQNQQLVVEAMVEHAKNIRSVDDFYTILDDIANNVDTNMSTPQMLSLYNVGKNILINKLGGSSTLSIQKTYLTGYDLTMYLPSTRSYVYTFQYYRKSLEDIINAMKVNLELEKPKLIKTFSFSANEPYELTVAGQKYYNETRRELLPDFIGLSRSDVETWAEEREIEVIFNEITEEDELYNSSFKNGQIVGQKEHAGQLVDKLSNINLSIFKKSENAVEDQEEKPKEEISEELPNFIGMKLSEFNKWKNDLKNSNMIIETKELTLDDLLEIENTEFVSDTIYKQSHKNGTPLEEITTLTVYYYREVE